MTPPKRAAGAALECFGRGHPPLFDTSSAAICEAKAMTVIIGLTPTEVGKSEASAT